jgi:hypothetical protein
MEAEAAAAEKEETSEAVAAGRRWCALPHLARAYS